MKPRNSVHSAAPDRAASWLRLTAQGGVLDLAVIPNARRSEWAGLHDGALRLRLAAPPVDGAANQALLRWLAKDLGVRQANLMLISGQGTRRKRVAVTIEAVALQRWQSGVQQHLRLLAPPDELAAPTLNPNPDSD
jgi:uncharacterized protein (TIGR00251 family)